MRIVRWFAAVFVIAFGGLLVAAAFGFAGMVVHADAANYALILGCALIVAGVLLRPRPR